jgi:lipoate-protein ligase A
VGGEVLVDGRKVIGSAQRVFGDRLLQHGAIALRADQHRLARYRQTDPDPSTAASEMGLDDAEATAAAITQAWQREGAQIAPEELTSSILLASVEYHSHYLDPAWTWRR